MRFKFLVVFIVLTICAATHGQMIQNAPGWIDKWGRPHLWPQLIFGGKETTTQSGSKNEATVFGNSTVELSTTTDSMTSIVTSTTNFNANETSDTPENAE